MTKGIKYISLWEDSGYGIAAKRYIRGLVDQGVALTWTPMVTGSAWGLGYEPLLGETVGDPEFDQICNIGIPYDTVIVHTVPEYFPMWVEREPGKHMIGYTVWETDALPRHWKPLLESVDQLMVPCHWNKEVMEQGSLKTPIDVIPHAVADGNPHHAPPAGAFSHPAIRSSDFVFYSINSWTPRKALWDTLEAYLEAFSSADPVVLVLKTTKDDFSRPWRLMPPRLFRPRYGTTRKACQQIIDRYRKPARVVLIDWELSDQEVAGIHQRGDCYVSLCRTEGWGLGAFDACYHGKPVVMTGFGGQLDYLPEQLACLVKYKQVTVEYYSHLSSYTPDQQWAKADVADGARWMRHVFENQEEAQTRGIRLREYAIRNFNTTRVCQRMRQQIDTGRQRCNPDTD